VIANVVNIVKVVWAADEQTQWLMADLATLFQNLAYCLLALRYLFVVRGNRYVMQRKPIPKELENVNARIWLLLMAVNIIVPVASIVFDL
jgi:hypothetical protein